MGENTDHELLWSDSLKEELQLFQDLAQVAASTRDAALDPAGVEFGELLEKQTQIMGRLETIRASRAELLKAMGLLSRDLLVVVLNKSPRAEHPEIMELFGQYIEAAKQAQRQIDINREYFSVALGTVEDTISALTAGVTQPGLYDAQGLQRKAIAPLCMSTMT